MIGLVDADLILYKAAFVVEKAVYFHGEDVYELKKDIPEGIEAHPGIMTRPTEEGFSVIDNLVRGIEENLHFILDCPYTLEFYLTGKHKNNYRYKIDPEYKAGRKPKPKCFNDLREYLFTKYACYEVEGQEPDDEIGIRAVALGDQAIVISNDKDLNMIPGYHFNFDRMDYNYITPKEALRSFFIQLVMGDRTDNVIGIPRYGEIKSARIVDASDGSLDLIKSLYETHNKNLDDLLKTGRLLWIRRQRGEMWHYDFHTGECPKQQEQPHIQQHHKALLPEQANPAVQEEHSTALDDQPPWV